MSFKLTWQEDQYVYRIGWVDSEDGCMNLMVGEDARTGTGEAPTDREAWELWMVERTAKDLKPSRVPLGEQGRRDESTGGDQARPETGASAARVGEDSIGARLESAERMASMTALLTTTDIAAICGVDGKTVHNWVNGKHMPHFRTPGRHLRFKPEEVVLWLAGFGYIHGKGAA